MQTFTEPPGSVKRLSKEDGLSLLEIVIAVAIVAIFAILGFLAFQKFMDNARQTAVERAANEVFTVALAEDNMPNGKPLADVEQEYNDSSDDEIRVEIEKDTATRDITVTAYGWEDRDGGYIAVRSTDSDRDGVIIKPGDNTEDEEDPGENTYHDGNFEFSTSVNNSIIYFYGVSENATATNGDETWDIEEGANEFPGSGKFTVNGGFTKMGPPEEFIQFMTTNQLPEDLDMQELLEINQNLMRSPFTAADAKITLWEDTGTRDISGAFAVAQMESIVSPPDTVENMQILFYGSTFNGDLSAWDTSNVKDMSYMFYQALAFNQPLNSWDTSSVKDMSYMFSYSMGFNQNISSWDTSSVETMEAMFDSNEVFDNGGEPLAWDNTSNVHTMSGMFRRSSFNQDVSNLNVSSVQDMSSMFESTKNFNQDLSNWDVSSVTDMNSMFFKSAFNNAGETLTWNSSDVENMSFMFSGSTANPDLSGMDTSSVQNMSEMFSYTNSFNQDISDWDMSQAHDLTKMFYVATAYDNGGVALDWEGIGTSGSDAVILQSMFEGAENFDQDISTWGMEKVSDLRKMFYKNKTFNNGGVALDWEGVGTSSPDDTTMENMFAEATAFNQDISNWDVSNVTDMSHMFYGATAFENGGRPLSWGNGTRNVEDMESMFSATSSTVSYRMPFNQPLDWDVSSVQNMKQLFHNTLFNQPLNSWNTANVQDMSEMFKNNTAFNQPIDKWNTSQVKYMQNMFDNAIAFNQPISKNGTSWDTGSVTDMSRMFYNARNFNQDISNWDVSNVTDMSNMFSQVTNFNAPIGKWDTSNVTDMSYMFYNVNGFNQPLHNWDTSKVTNMKRMFDFAWRFNQDISSWDTSNVTDMTKMFYVAQSFNQDISKWDVSNVTKYDNFAYDSKINGTNKMPNFQ